MDGGACVNDLLMQFQANLLGIPVVLPAMIETTALGAAYLAGVYQNTEELGSLWQVERRFEPAVVAEHAAQAMAGWENMLCGKPCCQSTVEIDPS